MLILLTWQADFISDWMGPPGLTRCAAKRRTWSASGGCLKVPYASITPALYSLSRLLLGRDGSKPNQKPKTMKSKLASFLALIVFLLVLSPPVSAAVPAAYTDGIAGVITDGTTMATAAFAALIGFAVVVTLGAIAIRMVKKARSAA